MTKTRSITHPHPDLSALMDKSAEEWSAPEIQDAARAAMQTHAPDREPITRSKRFGIVPWMHRNHALCTHCGGTYPCITHRYASQLLSAGRYTMAAAGHDDHTDPEPQPV
ncbi:hypothetical protein E1263_16675 [Kribbella antibiotica]|uniref:Uncharacterized protein n=1 Tax=Kribbella antibiotica TaxID=190195 RepID=A0A4R4ZLR0_9ACTN|nr:hypothetical protein [Kribbella antibiotica]TDD59036.1 hypothetical protein E1263_16675 [Kribbella antibiotica]